MDAAPAVRTFLLVAASGECHGQSDRSEQDTESKPEAAIGATICGDERSRYAAHDPNKDDYFHRTTALSRLDRPT